MTDAEDPRQTLDLGKLTESEQRRKLTCEHCNYTWVPRQYSQTHICGKCKGLNYRNKRRLEFGAVPEPAVWEDREDYNGLETDETHEQFFNTYQLRIAHAIYELTQQDRPCFGQAIRDYLDMSRKCVNKHIHRFEEWGYIEREWTGRGRKEIYLTDRGKHVFAALYQCAEQLQHDDNVRRLLIEEGEEKHGNQHTIREDATAERN